MDKQNKSVEVSARSVDEAVLQGLQQLGLSRDEVEIEVIKQGSRGLLGLLSEDAVVRVTARVAASEVRTPAAPPAADQDEMARLGTEVLQNLVNYMGLRAHVTRESTPLESQTSSESVLLNVNGSDLGLLIGRRGETLRDLQFLTCLIISRNAQHWPNLIVDVEHYKSRREKSLIGLARRMADRVRLSSQSVSLEPMPPHERRIVHLALRDDPDVFTESVGQDERRKVVIMLKK
jgi:spoIIIJ-associated protein